MLNSPNLDAMMEVGVRLGGVTQPVLQVARRQMRHNVEAEHHAEPMRQQRVNILGQTRTADARLSKGVEAGHARLQSSAGKDAICENRRRILRNHDEKERGRKPSPIFG